MLIRKVNRYVSSAITGKKRPAKMVSPTGSLILFSRASLLILLASIVEEVKVVVRQQQQQQHEEHVGVATVALERSLSNWVICLFILIIRP